MSVAVNPTVTTGPIAGSSKFYSPAGVPSRRVHLSTGDHLDLYDTSGPYTDEHATIDLEKGLPPRAGIVSDRGTQLQRARNGEITAEMAFIAEREGVSPSWCATRWRSAAPSSRPTTTIPRVSR